MKVELEIFEGPLDLLLYLIKKDEIDIYNIPIEKITRQYLEYIELMRMLDLNIAGEFLVMAATLMYIKSKMLLPPEERPLGNEVEEEDPRLDLVRQLLEYKKFKDVAQYLQHKELLEEKIFTRHAPPDVEVEAPLVDVSIFDLIGAFNQVLKKVEKIPLHEIIEEDFTVADKISQIKNLLREIHSFNLTRLFDNMKTRIEVVVTFLALLELIRLKVVRVLQKEMFGEIVVEGLAYE
jgi:segregation and condensation protein A